MLSDCEYSWQAWTKQLHCSSLPFISHIKKDFHEMTVHYDISKSFKFSILMLSFSVVSLFKYDVSKGERELFNTVKLPVCFDILNIELELNKLVNVIYQLM